MYKPSNQKPGSVPGGILLVSGSCIGAGMLALPIVTGMGGFFPSMFFFICAWLFMTLTGLLLMEVNITLGHHLSLISLAEKTLGSVGKFLTWTLFLFLFYSLGIAYIAASGSIVQTILLDVAGINWAPWMGSLLFTLLFGIVVLIGVVHVDYLNRMLMVGLILSYAILVFLGSQHINYEYLTHSQWKYAVISLPILVISFGFHNMIPSLAMYFEGSVSRLRMTLLLGSLIPLVIYLLWELIMLGILPPDQIPAAVDAGETATTLLHLVVGKSWINSVAQAFALFAIVTSFLTQSLSLVDFLADGLKVAKVGVSRCFLVFLTLAPPFVLAFLYPSIFLHALNLAGGICAVLLFGVMPALMVWVVRYRQRRAVAPLIPTTRPLLLAILIVAVGIFLFELAQECGLPLLKQKEMQ